MLDNFISNGELNYSWHQKAINYPGDKDIRNKNGINIYGISITEQEWKEFARIIGES